MNKYQKPQNKRGKKGSRKQEVTGVNKMSPISGVQLLELRQLGGFILWSNNSTKHWLPNMGQLLTSSESILSMCFSNESISTFYYRFRQRCKSLKVPGFENESAIKGHRYAAKKGRRTVGRKKIFFTYSPRKFFRNYNFINWMY